MMNFDDWAKSAGKSAEIEDVAALRKIGSLEAELKDERRRRKLAEKEVHKADQRAAVALALLEGTGEIPKVKPRTAVKSMTRACPVAMLSDWHVEEVVDPATIDYLNEYNPKIAEQRVHYLAEGIAWQIIAWARSRKIDEVVIWVGGDMISGYIHDELVEGNALSPTEATLFAQELIAYVIDYVLQRCKFLRKLHVYCSYGNHGRTTAKRRIATGAKNSFEWMAYHTLKQHYSKVKRVEFHIANGIHLNTEIYGLKVRFHHGDDVRFNGGVGGLSIPLHKAVLKWNTTFRADITVIGHWHQFKDFDFAVVNGSLIGWNQYALSVKAEYEPPRQGMFLIDAEWGKKEVVPIYCDPKVKARRVA